MRFLFGPSARASVIRTAIIYTPLFILTLLAALLILFGVWDGGIVLLVIALVLAVLFGYQCIQSLRDLRAEMRTTRGPVARVWSKMDLLVTRSYYLSINRGIYRVPFQAYYDLREEVKRLRAAGLADDYAIEVEIVHYPHTGTVESVQQVGRVSRDADATAKSTGN